MNFIQTLKSHLLLKMAIAWILTVTGSKLHMMFNPPCTVTSFRDCDYYYGFPIPYWLVTDYWSAEHLLLLITGFAGNIAIWFIICSAIQSFYKKLKAKN